MVATSFDGAGRPSGVSGVFNSVTTPYASGVTYAAHGGLEALTTGDGLSRAIGAAPLDGPATGAPTCPAGFTSSSSRTPANWRIRSVRDAFH
ncbi:MAG: hypothetical protein LAP40_21880 [Acidobacteriia bacterium]|nr:hypothetical protein [Terriglobia bacterium]